MENREQDVLSRGTGCRPPDAGGGAPAMVSYHAKDPTALGLSVSALVWRDEQILLMQRADNGLWGLPGGFVEVGESVAEAARREVEEETGWTADIGRLIGVYSDPSQQVVDYGPRTRGPITGQATAREARPGAVSAGGVEGAARRGGRIQIVNLCFHAQAIAEGEPTTPEETLAIGFFGTDALPEPFVPIHVVRIEDGLAGRIEASVR